VDGKQVSMKDGVAAAEHPRQPGGGGEVVPEPVGEMKLTVKVDEGAGEYTSSNNE